MKSITSILICVLIHTGLLGQKSKIKHEVEYFDLKKSNISKEYYYHVDNKKRIYEGEYRTYYPNGQIEELKSFKNGLLNGKFLMFYQSGQKLIESEYLNNFQVGELNKFYSNGQLMLNAVVENNKFIIKKYGFPDGSYANKVYDFDSTFHYNIFENSGKLLCMAVPNFNSEGDSLTQDCLVDGISKYPQMLIELQQEGLVVLDLSIDKTGKLINAKSIIGFHEKAIEESLNSIKKSKCFPIRLKNGEPIDYEIKLAFIFKMRD